MNTSNAYNQYKENSVNFASKEQLLLLLLDNAVKFSKVGRQAIIEKNIKKSHENLKKAQNIFYELIATLDLSKSGDWGQSMVSVYNFIIESLIKANIKKDISIMDEVIPIIEEVRNTWTEAYKISVNSK
ncbi:flagellar export chaperone FliS [Clostridium akagii]|uniref:flagellar export chaperone FliS n=1 Tax=Clostridium akagii TaxID=91623 RepID=UPI000479B707|nr:flagellar export chaperone FliS [Clostridium akagii]